MNPLQVLIPLAFLLLVSSDASVLEDTCKSFAATHTDIGYDFCIKFFQEYKGSATAEKHGLASIAVMITGEAARSIVRRIPHLKGSTKDGRVARCLSDCTQLYSTAAGQTEQAEKGIGSRNAGGLQNAVTALSSVLDAPDTCEQGFKELKVPSPLAAEDAGFRKEAAIALSTTSALFKSA